MKSLFLRAALLSMAACGFSLVATNAGLANEEEEKATEPNIISLAEGRVRLEAPAEWESKEPATRILEYEFAVPPVEGDENPGRVTVMGAGGGVEANIKRWVDQFEQPDGSDSKEKAKIEKQEINDAEVHVVSITGTYKDRPGGGPFTQTPIVLREDYRMLAAIIVTEGKGHYFIKLYGPEKTVDAQEEAFQKMLETLQVK